jgi:Restriction Endonuclease associating with ARP/Sigma-70, region 4
VARAIERLPELERLVFTYSAYEKLEDAEIAELLDLAEEEVEKLRAEATQRVSDAHRGENLRTRAERALVAQFIEPHGVEPDTDDRLANLRPLVVKTIHDDALEAALRDIAQGDGNEMLWTRKGGTLRPPGLHSVFSSCGLALNAFGPWRLKPESLNFLGESGYTAMRFEEKLRIFPRGGRAPNLDVVLFDDDRVTAVESKLTEHLTGGQLATFKESYERVIPKADASWQAMYQQLKRAPDLFNYLDAAQLVRHYLGLKTQTGPGGVHAVKRAVLVYLFWEPANAPDLQACATHADEVRFFAQQVADPNLPFATSTYRELWSSWTRLASPTWLTTHAGLLETRYGVQIAAAR